MTSAWSNAYPNCISTKRWRRLIKWMFITEQARAKMGRAYSDTALK